MSDTNRTTPAPDGASELANEPRPCPSWCTHCTGWEDDGRARTHRRLFNVGESAYVEVYAIEQADGTTTDQGANAPELECWTAAEALEYAGVLLQVSGFMQQHGIEVVTPG